MQISSRFTIAIHMLTCMETFKDEYKVTSEFLAASINVNPVIIRRILSQLKEAGIIEVKRGTGGAAPAKPLEEITFLDVYRAVECIEENALFHFHENPNPDCPVGRNIHKNPGRQASEGAAGHGAGAAGNDHGRCDGGFEEKYLRSL